MGNEHTLDDKVRSDSDTKKLYPRKCSGYIGIVEVKPHTYMSSEPPVIADSKILVDMCDKCEGLYEQSMQNYIPPPIQ